MTPPSAGRPREFDTEAALDAAMLVFWRQGFDSTSVSQLCEAMGIAKQSMYDWVGDKKGLFLASIERYRQTRICGLGTHLREPGSPLENLRHCLHAMAEYAKSPDCLGCLVTNTHSEFGVSDEEVARAVSSIESYILREFTGVLERAQVAGEISNSVDCSAVAGAIAVLRSGLMIAGRAGQSHESIDQTIQLIEALLKPQQ